jgi:hypothetical protein
MTRDDCDLATMGGYCGHRSETQGRTCSAILVARECPACSVGLPCAMPAGDLGGGCDACRLATEHEMGQRRP